MILYRCCRGVPEGIIHPSNWATNSIALEYFLDKCDELLLEGGGDKIVVIEIPRPDPVLVGPYCRIIGREVKKMGGREMALPFGDDGEGWWSFNRPYFDPFEVVDVLEREKYTLEEIDFLDCRYKKRREEWAPWLRDAA